MTNLRIFIEFAGHFLPILGDGGIYHVFSVPANCATINDVAYEILKKYDLQPLAPDGLELKVQSKYILLPRDNITNCIREGDQIHVSPRVVSCKWNQPLSKSSRKRKNPSKDTAKTTDNVPVTQGDTVIKTPVQKKRRITHISPATESIVSNVSSSSSSVTSYSTSYSDQQEENEVTQKDDINNEVNIDIETSDSDSSSDSSSDDDSNALDINVINNNDGNIEDEHNDINKNTKNMNNNSDVLNISHEECDVNNNNNNNDSDASIATMNDALKMLEERKRLLNDTKQEYLRSMKVNDRIKIWVHNEWLHGAIIDVIDEYDGVQLLMDNNDTMTTSLQQSKWEFEPENFIAPRYKHRKSNIMNAEEHINEEEDIKQWIEESGHERIRNKELKCNQMIAYKILELVNWEPVYSKYKIGEVVEISDVTDGVALIQHNQQKQSVLISNLCEIYKLKPKDKTALLKSLQKEKRKARRQKQKTYKLAGRSTSI